MILQRVSVGLVPLYGIQAAFACTVLMLLALWWHTHRYGPSFVVAGLKTGRVVTLHQNDAEYAEAIAKRFVHEYWNWSYAGQVQAKNRAAYFCTRPLGLHVLEEARAQDHYLRQLLDTCNGAIDQVKVAWSKAKYDHYLVQLKLTVQEWQSFAHTQYPVEAFVEVTPEDTGEKQFRMQVVNYRFTKLAEPQPADDDDNDPIEEVFREAAAAKDHTNSDHLTSGAGGSDAPQPPQLTKPKPDPKPKDIHP